MKKFITLFHPFLLLAAAALLLLAANAQKIEHSLTTTTVAVAVGNATRTADFLADDDDEFLMESEISRRLLAAKKTIPITPRAQNPVRPYCDKEVYGSCIGEKNKISTSRKCDVANHCSRPGK